MADVQAGGGRQGLQLLQAAVEGMRVAAFEVGAAAAVNKEGVAGDEVAAEVVAATAGGVAGGHDDADAAAAEADFVAIINEYCVFGAIRPVRLLGFADKERDALAVEFAHRVHMVVVAVGDEDAGEHQPFFGQHFADAFGVPGGIDDHRLARVAVGEDVDEVVVVFGDEGDDFVCHARS